MSEKEKSAAQVSGDNTKTQKTIRLRPVAALKRPTPISVAAAAAPSTPSPAAAKAPGDDTRTRKTVKMKPLMPKVASSSVTVDPLEISMPASPVIVEGEDTKTRRAIKLSQMKATVTPAQINIGDDDRTVKVKRPVAPASAAKPSPLKPTLKLNRPAPSAPAPAPVPAPAVQSKSAAPIEVDFDFTDEEPAPVCRILMGVSAAALLIGSALMIVTYFQIAF